MNLAAAAFDFQSSNGRKSIIQKPDGEEGRLDRDSESGGVVALVTPVTLCVE